MEGCFMKCSICHYNEASIYIEQNINGISRKYQMCGECAAKSDITGPVNFVDTGQNVSAIHSFWFAPEGSAISKKSQSMPKICQSCGLSFPDFKKTSMLGCSVCYDTFSVELSEVFRKLQPAAVHRGKIPKVKGVALQKARILSDLKENLRSLVACEEYEEAAKIRDEIRALEAANDAV